MNKFQEIRGFAGEIIPQKGRVVEREVVEREVVERPIARDCEIEEGYDEIKERGVEIEDPRERYNESAVVKNHDREMHWSRYHAQNTVARGCKRGRRYINYSAIDRNLQNEVIVRSQKAFREYRNKY